MKLASYHGKFQKFIIIINYCRWTILHMEIILKGTLDVMQKNLRSIRKSGEWQAGPEQGQREFTRSENQKIRMKRNWRNKNYITKKKLMVNILI